MARDYARIARALRAKAADPVVPPAERAALLERAADLEKKYGNANSRTTNDTTTTSRDGFRFYPPYSPPFGTPEWDAWAKARNDARRAEAERIAEQLKKNQWAWNTQYYGRDETPKPGYGGPDCDDIMEDTYKYDPEDQEDEDEGYDEFQ